MANNKLRYELSLDSTSYRTGTEEAIKSTKSLKQSTDEYLKDFGPLKKQMVTAKKEAQNLAAQFAMLSKTEKESEFGKELAENLQLAIEKAAELQDVFADTNDAIKNAASDTAGLDALKEIFDISKDATTAYIGVLGRLTNSEKELKNVVSSLAAVQGSFNAVIKTTNALQKNSATMIALQRSGVLSLAQAEKISAAATKASTVAIKGLGVAMKALPYVAVAAGVLAVGKAFVNFMSSANKAIQPVDNINKELTGTKKILADVANAYTNNYASALGKTMGLYRQLQTSYQQMSNTHEKTKWIKENSDKLKELGISTKDVNEVDRILINQSEQVIESFKLRAEAAAEAARLQSLYTQKIEAESQARERANKNKFKKDQEIHGDDVSRYGLEEGKDYYTSKYKSGMWLTDEGAMKAQQRAAEKNVQTYTAGIDAEIEKSANRLNEATVKYNDILKGLGITNFSNNSNKVTKEQLTELQRLNKIIKDLEDKKENINPLDPKATEKIKELDKQIREAKTNAKNFTIFIDYELDQKDYAKLQGLTGEINKIKNQIDDLDKTYPDYLKQFNELNNKLKAAEKELSNFKVKIGIEVADPDAYLKELKAEQKKFENEYKIAISVGDTETANAAREAYQKLQNRIDKYEIQIKNLKLSGVDAIHNELKEELDDAMEEWQIAVQNDDEAAEEAAYQAVVVAQRKLNEHDLKFKFKFDRDGLSSIDKDINKIFNDLNKRNKKYEFNFLPEGYQERANDILDRLDDLTAARQKLQDIIDNNKEKALVDPEAAEAIEKAQAALASTDAEYKQLTEDAEAFNEVALKIKDRTKDFERFNDAIQSVNNVVGSIDNVISSINNLSDAFSEGANGWEKFMAIMQTAMSVMSAVTAIMNIINAVQDVSNASKAAGNATLAQEVALHTANAAAETADTAAMGTQAGVAAATIAPTIALAKAMEKLAAANIYAAHSMIPFVGPAIASGYVIAMEAILATVGKFAEGGVVPGSSYTGDKLLARVNSGERILTAKQNENLEKIANNQYEPYRDVGPTTLSFKLKGEDIWGSMTNYKNIHRIS